MPEIELDEARCTGCGLCVDFCPVEVFDLVKKNGRYYPQAVRAERCWACDTCVGQCPQGALRVIENASELEDQSGTGPQYGTSPMISDTEKQLCHTWSNSLIRVLGLRWNPVAINLIPVGTVMPNVAKPRQKLRFCQSLMAARRGKSFLMPANCHACPDGTHILGLTEIPPKLATGELYLRFGKLDSMEAAQHMIAERPLLAPRSIQATLVTPLKDAVLVPDVIAVIALPEQMMWLCMAASYYTGKRFTFKVSGYNAQCVETTLIPYTTNGINISLGCYGCRASSDVSDDLMFMGIHRERMPELIRGLDALGRKAIPDSRNKIYLPPQT
ncbi:MAG: DUF169 domain-containing protein [Anaerolineales bacterium]|nr:DUF169 domain-containing protein [Anaerolineales bacterium]